MSRSIQIFHCDIKMKEMIVKIFLLDSATRFRIVLKETIQNIHIHIETYNKHCLQNKTIDYIDNSSVIRVPSNVNRKFSHSKTPSKKGVQKNNARIRMCIIAEDYDHVQTEYTHLPLNHLSESIDPRSQLE